MWMVPDAFHQRLGDTAGRQRLMDEEDHLLLILHDVPRASDDGERTPSFFWRNPEGEWKSTPDKGGMTALRAHLESYRIAILALDEEVENSHSAGEYFAILREAAPLLRATRHLLEVLQKARELRKDDRKLLVMRDEAVDLERTIDLISSDARNGMEFVVAQNAAEQSDLSYQATLESRRLNRLVAFFFPLATLISLFGMDHPENLIIKSSFWSVIAVGILLGLIVGKLVRRAHAGHTQRPRR